MDHLYTLQIMHLYNLHGGYCCVDDTIKHHTNYCKWIQDIPVLFDYTFKTNLKTTCFPSRFCRGLFYRLYKESSSATHDVSFFLGKGALRVNLFVYGTTL